MQQQSNRTSLLFVNWTSEWLLSGKMWHLRPMGITLQPKLKVETGFLKFWFSEKIETEVSSDDPGENVEDLWCMPCFHACEAQHLGCHGWHSCNALKETKAKTTISRRAAAFANLTAVRCHWRLVLHWVQFNSTFEEWRNKSEPSSLSSLYRSVKHPMINQVAWLKNKVNIYLIYEFSWFSFFFLNTISLSIKELSVSISSWHSHLYADTHAGQLIRVQTHKPHTSTGPRKQKQTPNLPNAVPFLDQMTQAVTQRRTHFALFRCC